MVQIFLAILFFINTAVRVILKASWYAVDKEWQVNGGVVLANQHHQKMIIIIQMHVKNLKTIINALKNVSLPNGLNLGRDMVFLSGQIAKNTMTMLTQDVEPNVV